MGILIWTINYHHDACIFSIENEKKRFTDENALNDDLRKKMKELNYEKSMIDKKKELLEKEKKKLVEEIGKLDENISKSSKDLEQESIEHVKSEQEGLGLKEELDFLKLLWDQVIPTHSP